MLTEIDALHLNEYQSVLTAATDLGLITDLNGVVQKVFRDSASYLQHQNITTIESLIHPDDWSEFQKLQSGTKKKIRARLHKQDGSAIWMLWGLCRHQTEDRYNITAYDLNSCESSSQSTSHSEAKLQQVLRDGMIGYWEVHFSDGTLSVSENIRKWWGLDETQVITNEIYQNLLHPEDKNKLLSSQAKILETLEPQELIHRTRKPDGSYIWIHGTGHPMFDEKGQVIGLMGTSMDITERVELENEVKHHQAKILTSSRLSAIGEMAGSMAHEINNPLAIILLHAEQLQAEMEKGHFSREKIKRGVEKISQSTLRISRIIRSLRTLSREGQDDPFEPLSVRRALEETLEICGQRLLNEKIDLKLNFPPNEILINARPTQISQVFLNLLNNAYDAIEKSEMRWIEVSIFPSSNSVEIVFKDSGCGVPRELQEKIFDPFFTTKDPTRGTGIGLSVSRSIILSHSGTLELNSASVNTEFIIRLPILKQA